MTEQPPPQPSQRFALKLPNGMVVTVTATPELLATAARVRAAMDAGVSPDPVDLRALLVYLAEDT